MSKRTDDSIFALRNGRLHPPSVSSAALQEVTRAAVFDIAEGPGFPVEEGLLTRYVLYTIDECVVTSTEARSK